MSSTEQPSVMQRLRDETQELHRRAEAKPLEQLLISGLPSFRAYTAFLEQRYLIHQALETHVRQVAETDPRVAEIAPPKLFQTENLRRDLEHFGQLPIQLADSSENQTDSDDEVAESDGPRPCPATANLIAAIERAAEEMPISLLGFYYVFEGSKNGARFIAQRLGPILELSPGQPGLCYLDPHGPEQQPLWQAFKQRMDAANFSPKEIEAQVAAAKLTFMCVGDLDDEIMAEITKDTARSATPQCPFAGSHPR